MLKSQRGNKTSRHQKRSRTLRVREENHFQNSNVSQIGWGSKLIKTWVGIKIKQRIGGQNKRVGKKAGISPAFTEQDQHYGRWIIFTATLYSDKWRTDTVNWGVVIIKKNSITKKWYDKKIDERKGWAPQ